MDLVDKVSYEWDDNDPETLQERTRQAYQSLFDGGDPASRLVMRDLVQQCGWLDMSDYSDPITCGKQASLHRVIRGIKVQLNRKEIDHNE